VAQGPDKGCDSGAPRREAADTGRDNIWTQPIRNRIDMLSTQAFAHRSASRSSGPICARLETKSKEIKQVVGQVPGAVDLYAERTTGSPYLEMTVDRAAADRYGLNVADVEDAIETAIGGKNLTTTIEGRQRFRCAFAMRAISARTGTACEVLGGGKQRRRGAVEQSGQHPDNDGANP